MDPDPPVGALGGVRREGMLRLKDFYGRWDVAAEFWQGR